MTVQRWRIGQSFDLGGIRFQVSEGKKAPGDLRLDWLTTDGWRPIPFSVSFLLADFHYYVEDILYPRGGRLGGEKFLREMSIAGRKGWQVAQERLNAEKQRAKETAA